MHLTQIIEGKTKLYVPDLKHYTRKEDAPVFYNEVFKEDRDLSVKIFSKFFKEYKTQSDATHSQAAHVADILCASGARGIRYANECGFEVQLNDASPSAIELVKKNAKLSNVKVKTSANEANRFLLQGEKFDLIDIDPFGSPVKFIETALKAVKPRGIIALSATDLGTLSGHYPKACFRRYNLVANVTSFRHELGLRNLIGTVALRAMKYGYGIVPIFAYTHQHYYRVYLKIRPQKNALKEVGYYNYCNKCGFWEVVGILKDADTTCKCGNKLQKLGPTWIDKLGDYEFMKYINSEFVNADELKIKEPYYDLHFFGKKYKIKIPKTNKVIEKLKEKGYKATKTLLCGHALKTNAPFDVFEKLIK